MARAEAEGGRGPEADRESGTAGPEAEGCGVSCAVLCGGYKGKWGWEEPGGVELDFWPSILALDITLRVDRFRFFSFLFSSCISTYLPIYIVSLPDLFLFVGTVHVSEA